MSWNPVSWNWGLLLILLIGGFVLWMIFGKKLKRLFPKKNVIAVISLDFEIAYSGDEDSTYSCFMSALEEVEKMEPKAVVLRVNSPGGTIGASQEIHSKIERLKKKGIKVVALMEDVAASGGLYVCLPADMVIANSGTLTGSIGVILQGFDYSKIMEWLRLGANTIKSGQFKDIFSPLRSMANNERQLLEIMVIDAYQQFRSAVCAGRKLPDEQVQHFADGRILTGHQAQSLGLVDRLGSFSDALSAARELTGIVEDEETIEYISQKRGLFSKIGARMSLSNLLPGCLSSAKMTGLPLWRMPPL